MLPKASQPSTGPADEGCTQFSTSGHQSRLVFQHFRAGYGANLQSLGSNIGSERLDSDHCGTLARADKLGICKSNHQCLFLTSLGIFCCGNMDKGGDLHLTKPFKCCQELLESHLLRLLSYQGPDIPLNISHRLQK